MPLTAKEVRNAKPGRHSDGGGLYLLVKPSGSASWVLRVQCAELNGGKRSDFGIGSLVLDPITADIPLERRKLLTLAEAREKARIGRALAKAGINPSSHWSSNVLEDEAPATFRAVAEEVHRQLKPGWKDGKHAIEWLASLERYAFPVIGSMAVADVDANDIQKVLLPFWLESPETARRVKQRIGVILDHAHAKGLRSAEAPMRAVHQLMRGIRQPKAGHFAAMPYKDLPAFISRLRQEAPSIGRYALQFLVLTATRPGEVRFAKWEEIDLEAAEWRIPAAKMKAAKEHVVPLVPAAIELLERVREFVPPAAHGLVFPGNSGPMSDATIAKALRSTEGGKGYTAHGLRSTFRDWAADSGFNNDWAEAALAHTVAGREGKTAAAYKRTTYFEHRRDKLMPAWASFVVSDISKVLSLAAAVA